MEIVTADRIDPAEVYDRIQKLGSGSVVVHTGVVREKTGDRTTSSLAFERTGDIEAELGEIRAAIGDRWEIEEVVILRRLGVLRVGEVISVVAVSAPRRDAAFEACRYAVDRLKEMRTISKREEVQTL